MPISNEERKLAEIAREIFSNHPYDGKYILDGDKLIICQSNVEAEIIQDIYTNATINPLGDWTGGTDVDTGALYWWF